MVLAVLTHAAYDLVRDFAAAKLTPSESYTASLRHASHYLEVARQADDLYLQGDDQVLEGLSLFDLKTGKLVPMPSEFDEFTERASPDYPGGTDEERANRDLLRRLMEEVGFTVNPNEWWHFDYKDWESYAIYDISFPEAERLNGNMPKH